MAGSAKKFEPVDLEELRVWQFGGVENGEYAKVAGTMYALPDHELGRKGAMVGMMQVEIAASGVVVEPWW